MTVTENGTALLETDRSSSDTDINQSILERPKGASPSRAIKSIVATAPGFVTDDNGRMHPRGSESQVQYVVDGIPVTDNMSAIFSTSLDARTLRTVEVLTGGIPAEFGDKLAGVINVNTRSGLEGPTQGGLSFSGGSFSTGEVAADFSTTYKAVWVSHQPLGFNVSTLSRYHPRSITSTTSVAPEKAFFVWIISLILTTACEECLRLAVRTFRLRIAWDRKSRARISASDYATPRRV